ncbi:zinc ribbon domain-containing protein [Megalodesulfovibrio paquesii]
MSEARKIFPMAAFAALLKGVEQEAQAASVKELLSFMTGREICDCGKPIASALCRAYIYEQHPELARMKGGDVVAMGDNVSVTQLPPLAKNELDAIFARMEGMMKAQEELTAKVASLETSLAGANAKLEETGKSLAFYKGKVEAFEESAKGEGEKVLVTSQAKVEEYIGKVDELLKMIEDVKKHGVVTVAAGGAAPAAGAAAAAPAAEEAAVPDSFGFGASAPSSDGFGF